jgi:shikimate kinase
MKQNPIVLIGFMGVGKTSVGSFLAKKTKVPFCDTDKMITKSKGLTPGEIFNQKGERYFRQIETQVLAKALKCQGVISTGGGIVEVKQNLRLLKQSHATVVYIYGDLAHIMPRLLRNTRRPLIEKSTPRRLAELWEHRDKIYRSVADVIVDSTNKRNNFVAAEVNLGVALRNRQEMSRKEIEDSSRILSLEKELEILSRRKQNLENQLINHRFLNVIKAGFNHHS